MATPVSFLFDGITPQLWARIQSEELRRLTHQLEPYVDLEPIKRIRRVIKPISYDERSESEAQIVPTVEGFKIIIGAQKGSYFNKQRIRFTIAHEIGHTFFYNIENSPPSRLPELGISAEDEEKICDIFASELLMPIDVIQKKYKDTVEDKVRESWSIVSFLLHLRKQLDVSIAAISRRVIVDLSLWKGLIFLCLWLPKPNSGEGDRIDIPSKANLAWRVYENILPETAKSKGLFIPWPIMKDKYPKLKWPIIENIVSEIGPGGYRKLYLPPSDMGKIGNLSQFLSKINNTKLFTIEVATLGLPQREIWDEGLQSPYTKQKKPLLIIAIDLNP